MAVYADASVLLVDDETDILGLYSDYLQGIAKNIELATDGNQALELIKTKNFDCIVCDISMPKMSGLELLEEIRRMKKPVPFIIVTAYWNKTNAIQALRAGAFDFVEKPVKLDAFVSVVSSAIEVGIGLRSLGANVQKIFEGYSEISNENEGKILQHQRFALVKNLPFSKK